jgi:hypothetical protein
VTAAENAEAGTEGVGAKAGVEDPANADIDGAAVSARTGVANAAAAAKTGAAATAGAIVCGWGF